ncbi:apoptosis-inducing factor 3-like protein [Aphelenchoides avenae]|nr:apoptosis-inducing factor 3-like protein [Aphelenchus avenae]
MYRQKCMEWAYRSPSLKSLSGISLVELVDELKQRTPTPTKGILLCNTIDLKNGEMKEFQVEGERVLLIQERSQFYAMSPLCPNCLQPLQRGICYQNTLRCHWHGTAYKLPSGELVDGPGLHHLMVFKVIVKDGMVVLQGAPSDLRLSSKLPPMIKCSNSSAAPTVIIGSGIAGVTCAVTLRQHGYTNRIVILTRERVAPYNRMILSKQLNFDTDQLPLLSNDVYRDYDIELRRNTSVMEVNVEEKFVTLENSTERVPYSNLVLAMGSVNKPCNVHGSDLEGVFSLRTVEESLRIREEIRRKHVIVIGSGFLGLEIACAASKSAASVSVFGKSSNPVGLFGDIAGRELRKFLQDQGICIRQNTMVRSLEGYDRVSHMVLKDGMCAVANTVISAIGVQPCTSLLVGSRIKMDARGYVPVDDEMRTNQPNVYAIGDITDCPFDVCGPRRANLPHWQTACYQGRVAAMSILGRKPERAFVPFLWLDLFDRHITFAGDPFVEPTEVIARGSLANNNYVCYYIKNDTVVGVLGCGPEGVPAQFVEIFQKRTRVTRDEAVL